MLSLVSVWSTQKTQDFVVFWPLMTPSTTSSRSSALVLSQFLSPDLIRTFSTSIGIGAPESTCSIRSRKVSFDLFNRLICSLSSGGSWCGYCPQATDYTQACIEHRHHVTSKIVEQLHGDSRVTIWRDNRISLDSHPMPNSELGPVLCRLVIGPC